MQTASDFSLLELAGNPPSGGSYLRNIQNVFYLYTIYESEKNDILQNYQQYYTLEGTGFYVYPPQ